MEFSARRHHSGTSCAGPDRKCLGTDGGNPAPNGTNLFQRTSSTVPPEIKNATTHLREALCHRQACREALAATSSTDSLLALALTTWVAVHKLRLASTRVRLLAQAAASSHRARRCCELQEAWKRRGHPLVWRLARKLGGKRNGSQKRFFNVPPSIRPSISDWRSFLCGPS